MSRSGYTLVEILISVTLSLFLLLGVLSLFRSVGTSITDTQATMILTRNMNWVAQTLRNDLANLTEDPNKPSKLNGPNAPGDNGYFQIIEGMGAPYHFIASTNSGRHLLSTEIAKKPEGTNSNDPDNTVGDVDDIIMFTARSSTENPYRGKLNSSSNGESTTAEIIWFLRGNTLYRRVLLVLENGQTLNSPATPAGFYANNDVSVHLAPGATDVKANTLADLSRRENRFGHWTQHRFNGSNQYDPTTSLNPFPHPMYYTRTLYDPPPSPPPPHGKVNATTGNSSTEPWYFLRMPTLEECAHSSWQAGLPLSKANVVDTQWTDDTTFLTLYSYFTAPITTIPVNPYRDFWDKPNDWPCLDPVKGTLTTPALGGNRIAEDVIMTNVISFDVKVWNPYWTPLTGATATSTNNWAPPQYIDLGQDQMINPMTNTMADVNYSYADWNVTNGLTVGGINDRFGFCSKGKYAGGETLGTVTTPPTVITNQTWIGMGKVLMPCVYDTWTLDYERKPYSAMTNSGGAIHYTRTGAGVDSEANPTDPAPTDPNDSNPPNPLAGTPPDQWFEWECPPPYTTPLKGIEITIRCFDPRSKNIKQIRIVKDF